MAPEHTITGPHAHYRANSGLAPRPATDGPQRREYSTLDQVRARRGTIALSHQIIDFALHGPHGSPIKRRESETLWSLIDGLFNAG